MQYQSFPGVKGSSNSLRKLEALRLPSLAGKRCMDVGCNEGFFAGYALFDGASRVVGIDRSAQAVRKAQRRFPQAEFIQQNWETLPEGEFDLITLLSALHYADDQEALIHRLMDKLSDDGLLVLEISIAPNPEDAWVQVERSIDERLFPTRRKLGKLLAPYAWKVIGHSVNQPGDPLQRYVVHVRKLKPCVYLLMDRPGSGKSTLARNLFKKAGVPVVSGDAFYQQISQGNHKASQALRELVSADFSTASIDKTTREIFEKGFGEEMVSLWSASAGYVDFALDTYVPDEFHEQVRASFSRQGYFSVCMEWQTSSELVPRLQTEQRAKAYAEYLAARPQGNEPLVRVDYLKGDGRNLELRWHLDSPVSGEAMDSGLPVTLSGWLLTLHGEEVQLYVRTPQGMVDLSFNRRRHDAVQHVFTSDKQMPKLWQHQACGFHHEMPFSALADGAELGIVMGGQTYPLARLSLSGPAETDTPGMAAKMLKKLITRHKS